MAMNPYEQVLRQLEEKNAQDTATAQASAGTQAQQSYIDYMKSLKTLDTGLAKQGVTGGGSESALLGANVGYQRQKNLVAGNLATNLQGLSQNYMANRSAVETQRADWEAQRQAQEEQRFANTLTGFNTVGAVDNAIAVAQTTGETWKIGYLMAQRAALLEQSRALASANSSSDTYTPLTQNDGLPPIGEVSATQSGYSQYQPLAGSYSAQPTGVKPNVFGITRY